MKTWKIRNKIPKNYLRDLDEPELLRRILFYRGIKTEEEAGRFLNPDYERDLEDPLKILNMNRAVRRIIKAIKGNEKIIIFGDYDADGVCGSVLFYDFFKKIGFENFEISIPDRHNNGYGLNFEALDKFINDKVNLIITVDCGITDFEEIKKAKAAGIDVIIADHHLVPETLPPAFAILDLHQTGEKYPFKFFSGAGLAFKTIEGLIQKGDFKIVEGWSKWLLDLVALSTIADMVPLLGENRVLVHYGLKVFQKTKRPGLKCLYQNLNLGALAITEDDIGFLIAPRINIASRMGKATEGFDLLTTGSESEAEWLVSRLEEQSNERKRLVEEILKEIKESLEKGEMIPEIIVAGDDKWSPGVLGLACNRIMDNYSRPVFLWGKGESRERKGSARSNGLLNLVELMRAMPSEFFLDFGGHALAAGFSLREDASPGDFEKNVLMALDKIGKEEIEPEVLWIDAELSLDDTNWALVSLLERLRPFGMKNPKPVFLFSNIEVFEIKEFGNNGVHLELKFKKSSGEIISAIGFFMQNGFSLEKGSRIDLTAFIEKSGFKGYDEIRLRIVDLKPSS